MCQDCAMLCSDSTVAFRNSWSMLRVLRGAVIRPTAHKAALFTSSRWRRPWLFEVSTDVKWFVEQSGTNSPILDHIGRCISHVSYPQADYYEGWGLHGRFVLVESAVMDCLSEDKGLVAVREGYDRYRGVPWTPGRDVKGCKTMDDTLMQQWYRDIQWHDTVQYPILCFFWVRCATLRWTQIN